LRGGRDDKIECELFPSALASSGNAPSKSKAQRFEYEALSYWWGQKDEVARQEINIFRQGTFYVRENLEAALRQLRSVKKDVVIWVDAICINQEDKKEKMAQVSRMHDIYTEAKSVCVWLGVGTQETKETFKFLREILDLQLLDSLIAEGKDPEKWWLVVRLLRNAWFSRRWVIQELTLAGDATVRWGESKMPWPDFADAIALFMTKHDDIKRILSGTREYQKTKDPLGDVRALGANTLVNATNNLFRKSEDGKIQQRLLPLEVLVSCLFLAFEASNPRDTIYAILSIAKDTSFATPDLTARSSWQKFFPPSISPGIEVRGDIRISPDYDKNIIDVYADFMDYCIDSSKSLDILCRHWAPTPQKRTNRQETLNLPVEFEEEDNIPTWIPSIKGHAFGAPEDALIGRVHGDSFVGHQEREHQQHYNASAGLHPWVKFGKCEEEKGEDEDETTEQIQTESRVSPETINEDSQDEVASPKPSFQRPRKFDGTLSVKGFPLAKIKRISGRISQGLIQREALEMGGWSPKSKMLPEKLWRTLVADRGPSGTNAPSWYRRACMECLEEVDPNGDLFTNDLKDLEGTSTTQVAFLERVQRVVWNRRFFQSTDDTKKDDKSLFGLAPPDVRLGDVVCIIFGCTVPVVLRECKTADDTYFEFIGECYVHGFMDGEAIPKTQPTWPYDTAEVYKLR
jgi:hypothetical protein